MGGGGRKAFRHLFRGRGGGELMSEERGSGDGEGGLFFIFLFSFGAIICTHS